MKIVLSALMHWLHLLATVVWIGGITANMLVFLPSIKTTLEPAAAGKLMGAVMGRFRKLIYLCIFILLLSGGIINYLNKGFITGMPYESLWTGIAVFKHIIILILIVLVVYAFEGLAPKVAKAAAAGPSPELAGLQKKQMALAFTGFILGMAVLLLTGIMVAASSIN